MKIERANPADMQPLPTIQDVKPGEVFSFSSFTGDGYGPVYLRIRLHQDLYVARNGIMSRWTREGFACLKTGITFDIDSNDMRRVIQMDAKAVLS